MIDWREENKNVLDTALKHGLTVVILCYNQMEAWSVKERIKRKIRWNPYANIIHLMEERIIIHNKPPDNPLGKTQSVIYILIADKERTRVELLGQSINLVLFTTRVENDIKEAIIQQLYPQMLIDRAKFAMLQT